MKGKNLVPTKTITISTTGPVQAYLEQLVHSGLFGKNVAEAAERVMVRGIEGLIADGALTRKAPKAD